MRAYDIWKKMILAKAYSKEVITTRINTVFAVGQITPDEYTELVSLIDITYAEQEAQPVAEQV